MLLCIEKRPPTHILSVSVFHTWRGTAFFALFNQFCLERRRRRRRTRSSSSSCDSIRFAFAFNRDCDWKISWKPGATIYAHLILSNSVFWIFKGVLLLLGGGVNRREGGRLVNQNSCIGRTLVWTCSRDWLVWVHLFSSTIKRQSHSTNIKIKYQKTTVLPRCVSGCV